MWSLEIVIPRELRDVWGYIERSISERLAGFEDASLQGGAARFLGEIACACLAQRSLPAYFLPFCRRPLLAALHCRAHAYQRCPGFRTADWHWPEILALLLFEVAQRAGLCFLA